MKHMASRLLFSMASSVGRLNRWRGRCLSGAAAMAPAGCRSRAATAAAAAGSGEGSGGSSGPSLGWRRRRCRLPSGGGGPRGPQADSQCGAVIGPGRSWGPGQSEVWKGSEMTEY